LGLDHPEAVLRIAVVGTGISGLTCVELLRRNHEVWAFEAEDRPGGHTHTVDVELAEATLPVDTGFLVYTERTYPLLKRLFARLDIPTKPAEMSFSVSDEVTGIEWRGTSASTIFAQLANLAKPGFWRMLIDIVRFNRSCRILLSKSGMLRAKLDCSNLDKVGPTLAEFLADRHWSEGFVQRYLIPIGSSIWSANPQEFLEMPATTFSAFFSRHGLLRFGDQAEWRTVCGGARRYVYAILEPLIRQGRLYLGSPAKSIRSTPDGVEIKTHDGRARFDQVILACHGDEALRLLEQPTAEEQNILGAMRYRPNEALLHTDRRLLPKSKRAWASWNYHRLATDQTEPTLTYDITRLQSLPTQQRLLVTLNRRDAVEPSAVLRQLWFRHLIVDRDQVAARAWHDRLNGRHGVWFCGAYWGDGFHEDGVRSAVAVCNRLGGDRL